MTPLDRAGHLVADAATKLIPPLRRKVRQLRARRSPWEVHQGPRPGLIVVVIPGFEKPPAVVFSARDVRRDVIGSESTLRNPGWSVYGSPGKSTVCFIDGTRKTFGVQSADLIRELDEAERRAGARVDVRAGGLSLRDQALADAVGFIKRNGPPQ